MRAANYFWALRVSCENIASELELRRFPLRGTVNKSKSSLSWSKSELRDTSRLRGFKGISSQRFRRARELLQILYEIKNDDTRAQMDAGRYGVYSVA